jgi:hypothetical protein
MMTWQTFETTAASVMGAELNANLAPGSVPGVPKQFDLVSNDKAIVGDAKFFTLVNGTALPPAKWSIIAEHVWLLEKTDAAVKFLAFGNDRRVPEKWLQKYGSLVRDVRFYFIDPTGSVERLNG